MIDEALPLVRDLCVKFEGVRLRPYLCPAGVGTVGVGSTRYADGRAVQLTDPPITLDQAMRLLDLTLLRSYLPGTLSACPGIDTPERLAAIADFSYNLGLGALYGSTLRKRINSGRWDDVPAELRKWVNGGGRKLPGLIRRREAEIALL